MIKLSVLAYFYTLLMTFNAGAQDTPLSMVLSIDSKWEKIAGGLKFCDATVKIADKAQMAQLKVSHDGKIQDFGRVLMASVVCNLAEVKIYIFAKEKPKEYPFLKMAKILRS